MRDDMPSAVEVEIAMLKVMAAHSTGMDTKDIRDAVSEYMELSRVALSIKRAGGRQELGYRLSWARTKAQQKGYVERIDAAIWRITDLGRKSVKDPNQ
jgi:restriction endonuclease Mrr